MEKLFGTDGIRGKANFELTGEIAFKIGKAGAYVLSKNNKKVPTILLGKDTRISGDMLEASLVAGMTSVGARVIIADVIPTPSVAYLIRHYNFDAGIMISASHNSYEDNGIKFFNHSGYKLSDELEEEIENLIFENKIDNLKIPESNLIGVKEINLDLLNDYKNYMLEIFKNTDLSNLKIVLDCGNGATYKVAPEILKSLKGNPTVIFDNPNGLNINENCGSTHLENLKKSVLENKADIGIAYDGDGDRCLLVDEFGNIVDGDSILSIFASNMKENNILKNNGFVATIMSNLGLFIMGEKNNLIIEKTNVGDRYVLEEMLLKNYNLGGEQSGHIIFLDHNTTGDGILASLKILEIMSKENKTLSEINNKMELMPQVLINANVGNKNKYLYKNNEKIMKEIKLIEEKFQGNGRVLIRTSGTEPLIRIMIEGENINILEEEGIKLKNLIESELK